MPPPPKKKLGIGAPRWAVGGLQKQIMPLGVRGQRFTEIYEGMSVSTWHAFPWWYESVIGLGDDECVGANR